MSKDKWRNSRRASACFAACIWGSFDTNCLISPTVFAVCLSYQNEKAMQQNGEFILKPTKSNYYVKLWRQQFGASTQRRRNRVEVLVSQVGEEVVAWVEDYSFDVTWSFNNFRRCCARATSSARLLRRKLLGRKLHRCCKRMRERRDTNWGKWGVTNCYLCRRVRRWGLRRWVVRGEGWEGQHCDRSQSGCQSAELSMFRPGCPPDACAAATRSRARHIRKLKVHVVEWQQKPY